MSGCVTNTPVTWRRQPPVSWTRLISWNNQNKVRDIIDQWFLNWVRSNPRGSVSKFQGFGGLVHPTCRIHHITLCLAIIEYLDEIIELHQRQVQQKLFKTIIFSTWWCHQIISYPLIAKKALEILIPSITTYLCEQSFSRMVDIKMKTRNRLYCENDMSGTCQGKAAHFWEATAKVTLICSKYS